MGQHEEIETIRERKINLKLSDADIKRIYEKAGSVGLTVSELLENFIGDLVHGTYSNGSDERMYAENWFDRCWFAMFPENTFLQYLINFDIVEDIIEDWNELKYYEQNAEEQENDRDIYEEIKERIDENFSDFIEQIKCQEKPKIEDEMEKIIKWWNEYQQIKNEQLQP